jgi:trehalose 6-phosphate synthase
VLADNAVLVNPYDVESTAAALHRALTMDEGERTARAAALRSASMQGSPEEWFAAQREVLREAVAHRRRL